MHVCLLLHRVSFVCFACTKRCNLRLNLIGGVQGETSEEYLYSDAMGIDSFDNGRKAYRGGRRGSLLSRAGFTQKDLLLSDIGS